jgi:tetratricopeptide (TPR) repeat protein
MTFAQCGARCPAVPVALLVLASTVAACGRPPGAATPEDALGEVSFGAPCDEAVLEPLDRGFALLHHMTYPAAQASFEEVMERDPDCALAYWGAAMTLFQPLWPNRPDAQSLARGWELAQEARRHVRDDGRESMFVATGEAFFDPDGNPDYWVRMERWEAATAALYDAFPDDREARAFHALAELAIASRADDPAAVHRDAAGVLAGILAEAPTHPGAVHYTIHANDFTGREHESLDVVRSYGEIAPANAHALHMPTHIFVRLGAWDEVIDWNRRAAEAARTQRVGAAGEYVWDEFPHAIEYVVYAHLQQGDDAAAAAAIRSLDATPGLQPSFKTAFHHASIASRLVVERADWAGAVGAPVRAPSSLDWDLFPWPEAVSWHARGLGGAHTGADDVVVESLDRLAELEGRAARSGEALFAAQIEILRLEVAAWQALVAGDRSGALERLEEAVALEERTPKHPVTPGPTIPARELLGDLYATLGEPGPARDAYRASNDRAPGRFNTLLGLARASAALGDDGAAREHYRALLDGAAASSTRPGVLEARAFLGEGDPGPR